MTICQHAKARRMDSNKQYIYDYLSIIPNHRSNIPDLRFAGLFVAGQVDVDGLAVLQNGLVGVYGFGHLRLRLLRFRLSGFRSVAWYVDVHGLSALRMQTSCGVGLGFRVSGLGFRVQDPIFWV
jgi:hypothetical protein